MPTSRRPANSPPVLFDDPAWAQDMSRATAAAREVGEAARREYETHGVPLDQLRACDPEGPDGTQLAHCVKLYLPQPHGRYGIVFAIERDARGWLRLAFAAFGLRHPSRSARQPSVYQIANRRLHARSADR
jgi:hypothetical protein